MRRRQFLRSALAATGVPLSAQQTTKIEERDPRNARLCHRLDAASVSDDDLRFLEQIGLKWVRLEFGVGEITLDTLRGQQRRFAQFGMRIYSGVHYAYRSRRVQLGEPGRDQDIETYRRFLRDLGMLEIPGDESAAAGEPDHVPPWPATAAYCARERLLHCVDACYASAGQRRSRLAKECHDESKRFSGGIGGGRGECRCRSATGGERRCSGAQQAAHGPELGTAILRR